MDPVFRIVTGLPERDRPDRSISAHVNRKASLRLVIRDSYICTRDRRQAPVGRVCCRRYRIGPVVMNVKGAVASAAARVR